MTLLQNDSNNQVSPISEGFTETRVNSLPCKGNNLTTWHTWATKARQVVTFTTMIKESDQVAPFPSVCLPRDPPHRAIRGWHVHYLGIHHYRSGEGSSNSATIEATMFVGFHIPRMCQYITQTCSLGPDDQSLTDTGLGLPPRSSESIISPLSIFPSSILHNPLFRHTRYHIEPQSDR
jgi:hypothetical protein